MRSGPPETSSTGASPHVVGDPGLHRTCAVRRVDAHGGRYWSPQMEISTCELHRREICGSRPDGCAVEIYRDQAIRAIGLLSYIGENRGPRGCVRLRRLIWPDGVRAWARKSASTSMRRIRRSLQYRRRLKCTDGLPDLRQAARLCVLWGPEDNDHRLSRPVVVHGERLGASMKEPRRESHFHEAGAVRTIAAHGGSICLFFDPDSLRRGISASTSLVMVGRRGCLS